MINLVKKYLEVNHFSNQKESFEELFQSHPNYPSIFAITDTLDILSIENVALKIPKEQFLELPDCFLTIYDGDFAFVQKTVSSVKIETGKEKNKKLTFETFLNGWNGVIIIIEPNTIHSCEPSKFDFKKIKYVFPVLAFIGLSLALHSYHLENILLLVTSILGLIVSVFIVQEKLGLQNEMVSKFCNMNSNTSCDSVIKSKQSNLNAWIKFSDLPLLFFGVNTLALSLAPATVVFVEFLSWVSLPIIAYSIWLQKIQLKKWCLLCLVVSFLLILQSVIVGISLKGFEAISLSTTLFYGVIILLISSLWLFLSPVFEKKIKAEKEVSELKKFKRNYKIFKTLFKEIPSIQGLEQLEGLQFGNPEADVKLSIILSPSCGHCHKTFQDGFELVSKFPERFFLNILFNINLENLENPYKIVVQSLLAINNSNSEKVKEAISDWHIRKMELDAWKQKWGVTAIDMKANHQVHEQYQWCLQNEFNFTPVKIINGKQFPNEYDISDLKYFLNDFSEERKIEVTF